MKSIENKTNYVAEYKQARSMKAVALTARPEVGTVAESIQILDLPIPQPGEKDVVVRIIASTIHIDDINMAQGSALGRFLGPKVVSAAEPYVLGSSYSGVVVAVGEHSHHLKLGDEVIGIPQEKGEHGSWAEYRCVNAKTVMLKPQYLSHENVAAMVMGGCVAYGVIETSEVQSGDVCLVLGASGGIGSLLTQMLKTKGATVIGVCSAKNAEYVLSLGAERIIDYRSEYFPDVLNNEGISCDLVFDIVGGKALEQDAYKVLQPNGKFMTVCGPVQYIGDRKLSWGETIRMFTYIFARIFFSRFRGPRYLFSERYPRVVIKDALAFMAKQNMQIAIAETVPLEVTAMKAALAQVASHHTQGRIVVVV